MDSTQPPAESIAPAELTHHQATLLKGVRVYLLAVPPGTHSIVVVSDCNSAQRTEEGCKLNIKDVCQTPLKLPAFQKHLQDILWFGALIMKNKNMYLWRRIFFCFLKSAAPGENNRAISRTLPCHCSSGLWYRASPCGFWSWFLLLGCFLSQSECCTRYLIDPITC